MVSYWQSSDFKLRLKLSSEGDYNRRLSDRKWYVIPDFRGTVGKFFCSILLSQRGTDKKILIN